MDADPTDVLRQFHPITAQWFAQEVGTPTAVQRLCWPRIGRDEHVLATAPTGSGKTFAAFLWGLDQLLTGAWPAGQVSLIYVSPLKALGTDVQRNLLAPLASLRARWLAAGLPAVDVQVQVRTGDTPARERARMLRKPPEILITTPESLNLLLLSAGGRGLLGTTRSLILDEIHAVAGSKRGTYLMTAVERLERLCAQTRGEPGLDCVQRVALSATVRPLDVVGQFVGGYRLDGTPRPVALLVAPERKVLDVAVVDPSWSVDGPDPEGFWPALVRAARQVIARNRSTLFFTQSRRMAEKLARLLNEDQAQPVAWAHHGSLSRELRQSVESRLKAGEIKALCATSALELGIDVGSIDEVVLIQAPRSLAACIQRIGRAGHQVGAASHGLLIPLHGRDALSCAVLAPQVQAGQGEPLQPVQAPLDVLAQVVLAMCVVEPWRPGDLFEFLRTCAPYRTLSPTGFELTLAMLRGRYADSRVRELVPRLTLDPATDTLVAGKGARLLLAQSGGVIPDRGYFAVRVHDSQARIGELDEEFVWERSINDVFTIGAQTWRIVAIGHDAVEVAPAGRAAGLAPFWRAETEDRSFELSAVQLDFLEAIEPRLQDPELAESLQRTHRLDAGAATHLVHWLEQQRVATGVVPHRHRVVIEHVAGSEQQLIVVHAGWGGRVLRPWALALQAVSRERFGEDWRILSTDDCLGLEPPEGRHADVRELLNAVTPESVEGLLRQTLGHSGFFGARFRENAGRALLLPRHFGKRRTPLWLTRKRAKSLLHAVSPYDDFPIVAETWRTCLQDSFDLPALRACLGELHSAAIAVIEVKTEVPSPFAEGLVWSATSTAMYDDDTPLAGMPLSERVLAEVAARADLLPTFSAAEIASLQARLQRTAVDWTPEDGEDLRRLLDDRVLIPADEWAALDAAVQRDAGVAALELPGTAGLTVVPVQLGAMPGLTTPDGQRRLVATDDPKIAALLAEWLRSYGPIPVARIDAVWGLGPARLQGVLADLAQRSTLVREVEIGGEPGPCVCDRQNLERLLRQRRRAQRPEFEALPLSRLPLVRAVVQGLVPRADGPEGVAEVMARLLGLPLTATLWEAEVLPARVKRYQPGGLDALLQDAGVQWYGTGAKQLAFAPHAALPLFRESPPQDPAVEALLPDPHARYDLPALGRRTGLPMATLAEQLWQLAWQGQVATAGMLALRQAALNDFQMPDAAHPLARQRLTRGLQSGKLWPDAWLRLPSEPPETDPMERAERDQERVRQLLDRHGVLFREVLVAEPPLLQWRRLLPAMRVMELSGELLAGHFFAGVPGLQFTTPAMLRRLQAPLPDDAVWWHHAQDPVSCCGIALDELKAPLPARMTGTHLVWQGARLVIISRRSGAALAMHVPPDDPDLAAALECLVELATRAVQPVRPLRVETVDGVAAASSAYRGVLQRAGFIADFKGMLLDRR